MSPSRSTVPRYTNASQCKANLRPRNNRNCIKCGEFMYAKRPQSEITMTTTTTTANNSSNTSTGNSISAPPMSSAPALSSSDRLLQFNLATKVYLVPCIDELTNEEYDNLWPTEEDNQRSGQHLAETLQALHLNNGEVPRHLEGQITSRGLESLLAIINSDSNSLDHPKTLKDRHTRTILDCQDQTTCPEAIAGASQITSQAARNRALDLANALERELRIDDEEE